MGRTRRTAIDGGIQDSGNSWYSAGSFFSFGAEGYVQFDLPFSIDLGGYGSNSVSTVTLWANGVLSLGPATQAQIDFFAAGTSPIPAEGNAGFPGFFFLFDHDPAANYSAYSYGLGAADYEFPFDIDEAVPAAFFTFENGYQIVLDGSGFSILPEFNSTSTLNGVYIGSQQIPADVFTIEFDNYPDFLTYFGTADDDTVTGSQFGERFFSSAGSDAIDGGDGTDLLTYELSASGVTVNLALGTGSGGDAAGDTIAGIEDVTGSDLADRLTGDGGGNVLIGRGGVDTIFGGNGEDTVEGGAGADDLDGGVGFDTLSYSASAAAVYVSLADLSTAGGDAEGDTIAGFEAIVGSNFDDVLQASAAGNELQGGSGGDTLLGLSGADDLSGGFDDDFLLGRAGGDTLDGGFGYDTASYAGSPGAVTIDLENGTASGGEAAGDTLSSIENIVGSTLGDALTGNFDDNRFEGGGGADTLSGRGGKDVLIGGDGADHLFGESGNDTLIGGDDDDDLAGGAGSDALTGDGGNDTLDGGLGADSLSGGAGDDTYRVDNLGDVVSEAAGDGNDRVLASASYVLSPFAFVETLAAADAASTAALNLTGNEQANALLGNAGANVLNGRGGVDVMTGFAGDDTYFIDHEGDRAIENAGGGTDTIKSSIAFGLKANFEVLVLTGTADINGFGNVGNETLFGNAGANLLNGNAGADLMRGGAGDDTYIIDNLGDRALENAGEGFDIVKSSVDLGLKPDVEVLALTGTDDLIGNGNAQDNFLYGNLGDNLLNGFGGADVMRGNDGDDTYIVDNLGDRVFESSAAGGFDTVKSAVSFSLKPNVEVLSLTGADNLGGYGNDGANFIYGNAGNNVIKGGAGADTLFGNEGKDFLFGGSGADQLTGGAGSDRFYFDAPLGGGNRDTIADYSTHDDVIVLDSSVFTGLAAGSMPVGAFNTGAAATQADDRIIYDPATGALLYDADGNGAGAAIHFASLAPGLAMTAGEFFII